MRCSIIPSLPQSPVFCSEHLFICEPFYTDQQLEMLLLALSTINCDTIFSLCIIDVCLSGAGDCGQTVHSVCWGSGHTSLSPPPLPPLHLPHSLHTVSPPHPHTLMHVILTLYTHSFLAQWLFRGWLDEKEEFGIHSNHTALQSRGIYKYNTKVISECSIIF